MTDSGDVLEVRGVVVDCVIGVYPEERIRTQPLVVSVRLAIDSRRASHSDELAQTVDYARLMSEVRFVLEQGKFLLIETAAEVIAATILSAVDALSEVHVTLEKPQALGGNGAPRLSITRHRDSSQSLWTFPFGVVEVLRKDKGQGLYRLRMRPQGAVKFVRGVGDDPALNVTVFAVDEGRDGVSLGPLQGADRRLENTATKSQTWLIASRPALRLDAFQGG
jgi:dihydroneopterin aldolase